MQKVDIHDIVHCRCTASTLPEISLLCSQIRLQSPSFGLVIEQTSTFIVLMHSSCTMVFMYTQSTSANYPWTITLPNHNTDTVSAKRWAIFTESVLPKDVPSWQHIIYTPHHIRTQNSAKRWAISIEMCCLKMRHLGSTSHTHTHTHIHIIHVTTSPFTVLGDLLFWLVLRVTLNRHLVF